MTLLEAADALRTTTRALQRANQEAQDARAKSHAANKAVDEAHDAKTKALNMLIRVSGGEYYDQDSDTYKVDEALIKA